MNFYNEIDPKGAEWIRNLIEAGEIPEGVVDERSIVDIRPEELEGFTQCHFFAGIGGWAYALRLAGWPDDRPVWTGSCPCQPFSVAGAGGGVEDERHLWPAFRWLISQCRPAVVFGEQVASADGRVWMSGVRDDLEVMGYDAGAADLCAAGVGAPHIRQRLFWCGVRLADSCGNGSPPGVSGQERSDKERQSGKFVHRGGECVDWSRSVWWPCRDGKLRRVPARWVGNAPERKNDGRGPGELGEAERGGKGGNDATDHAGADGGGVENTYGCDKQRGSPRFNIDRLQQKRGGSNGLAGNAERSKTFTSSRLPNCPDIGGGGTGSDAEQGSECFSAGADGGVSNSPQSGECGRGIQRSGKSDCQIEKSGPKQRSERGCVSVCDAGHDRLEVEPGLFPLADGVSGGVVVERSTRDGARERRFINRRAALFGAGNAIVPAVAAEFVRAFMEVA